jgi:hypothetical protein
MRRWEWGQQVRLALLLDRWLPDDAVWTATDPVAASALAGAMRKKRGVKPGVPDCLIWCGRIGPIVIELKTPGSRCSAAQREMRKKMLRAGIIWWECRTAAAAMVALIASGVKFRTIVHADGSRERYRRPKLAPWEVPRTDPTDPRPQHPDLVVKRREMQRRWMARKREREAAACNGAGLRAAQVINISDAPGAIASPTRSAEVIRLRR